MIDLDEVMRRKDLRTVSSGEIKCLFHEIKRLRAENLQFAEQVKCEYEHTRVARAWRDELSAVVDYLWARRYDVWTVPDEAEILRRAPWLDQVSGGGAST